MSHHSNRRLARSLALLLVATPVLAQGPSVEGPVAIFDARGIRLGAPTAASVPWEGNVLLQFGGAIYEMLVAPTYVVARGLVYFESMDCSGQPFIASAAGTVNPSMWGTAVVQPPGWTLWAPDDPTEILEIEAGSYRGVVSTCTPVTAEILALRASPLVDLQEVLTPPFVLLPDDGTPADLAGILEPSRHADR